MSERGSKKAGAFQKVGECLYRYSSNGVYYAVVRHQGKLIRKSLETTDKAQAKNDLRNYKRDLAKIDFSAGKITVGELLTRFEAAIKNLDSSTVEKQRYLAKTFRDEWSPGVNQAVRDVKHSHVLHWLGEVRQRASKSYYNDHVLFIRRVFQLAVDDRMIAQSPAADVKTLRRDTPIRNTPTWEQFKSMVEDIRSQKYNADAEDSADFVEFLGRSGLGNSEAANLKWEHIDFRREKITVFRNKTDTGFQIPIYPQLKPLLLKLHEDGKKPAGQFVFKIKNAKKSLAESCKRLKFPNYSHRALRRCFITRCIELGLDFKTVAALQGHRDGGVLIAKTYSHLRAEHVEAMAARLVCDE